MSMFSKSEAVCPHCLRKIKLGDMKFFCVPDEDNRHEVKPSFMDKIKGRLPVCRRKFCKNHGLTIREAVCKYCGEILPPQILFHDKFLSFCAVGVAGAGKSSYMTTLLHELKYSGLPWVLQAMDTKSGIVCMERRREFRLSRNFGRYLTIQNRATRFRPIH